MPQGRITLSTVASALQAEAIPFTDKEPPGQSGQRYLSLLYHSANQIQELRIYRHSLEFHVLRQNNAIFCSIVQNEQIFKALRICMETIFAHDSGHLAVLDAQNHILAKMIGDEFRVFGPESEQPAKRKQEAAIRANALLDYGQHLPEMDRPKLYLMACVFAQLTHEQVLNAMSDCGYSGDLSKDTSTLE